MAGELVGVYDADFERQQLDNLMFKRYGGMLRSVHGLVTRAFNLGDLPVDDVAMRHMLLEARARAVVVDAQTQFSISATIADGVRRGLSRHEIAYGTADGSYKGIEGLFTQTWKSRPMTVASTELQQAMLKAVVDRFRATRMVEAVIARDGDLDQVCASRNGKRFELSNPPQLGHPNCRLQLEPVVRQDIGRTAVISEMVPAA
jgi:hypothetical protein